MEATFIAPSLVFWTIFGIVNLTLVISALSILLTSKRVNPSTIFPWTLMIVFVPIFGAIFFLKKGRMNVREKLVLPK